MSELEKMRLQLYEQCAAKIMQGESPNLFFSPDGGLWETNILIGEMVGGHDRKEHNLHTSDRSYTLELRGIYGPNIKCRQGGWAEKQQGYGWEFSLNLGYRNLTIDHVIQWIKDGIMDQVELFANKLDPRCQRQVQSDDFQKILSDWTTKMGK